MTPYLKFLSQIVNQSIFIFLMVGAAFALIAGLMLLFDSRRAFRVGDWLDRWVSTRQVIRPLEKQHSIARPMYRMHRLVGALICAGALYALIVLGTAQGAAAMTKSLSGLGSRHFVEWLSESLRLFLLIGNAGALVFGLFFILRPSALKRLEAWADRSISGRQATKPLEISHRTADQFVRAHPRMIGALVILGSLYVLLNLGYALLR
jgi:hypothetical protein